MKKILEKGTGKRSDQDIKYLFSYLKYNDFFHNLGRNKDKSTLDQCFRCMALEFHPKNDFVFHFGQKGDKFYVLLKGEVKVMVPNENFNSQENLQLDNMNEIKILNVGSSFGELALFSNKTRTASIFTTENCYLATLKKKDFKRVLCKKNNSLLLINFIGGFEEIKSINFLLEFSIFNSWTFPELKEIFPKFFEKHYEKKNLVFKEGDKAEFLYFIKSGEFAVYNFFTHFTNVKIFVS